MYNIYISVPQAGVLILKWIEKVVPLRKSDTIDATYSYVVNDSICALILLEVIQMWIAESSNYYNTYSLVESVNKDANYNYVVNDSVCALIEVIHVWFAESSNYFNTYSLVKGVNKDE